MDVVVRWHGIGGREPEAWQLGRECIWESWDGGGEWDLERQRQGRTQTDMGDSRGGDAVVEGSDSFRKTRLRDYVVIQGC